ncbi:OmpA family protein [Nesterenkonia sphaerica]|uniref:OmpA family protein n=1 Tax=Nesterenkonia sphaerica TaxID=1804988 RepID=A0A5R9AN48_9MICC|nr:OmpA family protein [Nesterenkonia sphaerica]TLP80037.1 OmpA family protein [Nesterenkonia sphaerica]
MAARVPPALGAAAVLVLLPAVPALADEIQERHVWEEVDRGEFDASDAEGHVTRLDPEGHITRLDPEGHVDTLEDTREEGGETVISLSTDVLFDAYEWEVPDSAAHRLEELVEDVPDGAAVSVTGHTDSRPTGDHVDFDNQELSENRAEAVAEVLQAVRPDLDLEVSGVADQEPAVREVEDEPETFAQNRRVEIAYDSG